MSEFMQSFYNDNSMNEIMKLERKDQPDDSDFDAGYDSVDYFLEV